MRILQCHTPFHHKNIQINRQLTRLLSLGRFLSRLKMKVFIASVLLLVCANLSLQNEAVRNIYHLLMPIIQIFIHLKIFL